jgi:hypothetical protein
MLPCVETLAKSSGRTARGHGGGQGRDVKTHAARGINMGGYLLLVLPLQGLFFAGLSRLR